MPTIEMDPDESVGPRLDDDHEIDNVHYAGDKKYVTVSKKDYVCEECGKSFDSQYELNGHMASH